MQKETKNHIYLSLKILALLALSVSTQALAADEPYKLLAPLGEGLTEVSPSGFSSYLQRVVNISIGLAGALAVLMLVIGGLQYVLSSISEKAKSEAKDRMTNAILGLLIILSGYLILNTINPDLLSLDFPEIKALPSPKTPPPGEENIIPPPEE